MGEGQKGSPRGTACGSRTLGSPCHGLQDIPTPLRRAWTQSQQPPRSQKTSKRASNGRMNWLPLDTWEAWKEEPDANAYQEAEDLISALSRRFTTCDKRRVAPPWSVPNEIWLLALRPNWRKRQDKAVGVVSHELAAPTFLELLARTLAQTISTRQAPLIAHRSRGADIAKPNGKLWLLHILCPFWTQVYSAWFQQWGNKQEAVYWEHGFFRHKRRDEAILVCEIVGDEARREGRSTMDTLHDATNAFASTLTQAYAQTIDLHAACTPLLRNTLFTISSCNGNGTTRSTHHR